MPAKRLPDRSTYTPVEQLTGGQVVTFVPRLTFTPLTTQLVLLQ
jgi:hypothetical protein